MIIDKYLAFNTLTTRQPTIENLLLEDTDNRGGYQCFKNATNSYVCSSVE